MLHLQNHPQEHARLKDRRFLNNFVLAAQIDIYEQMLIIRKAIVEMQMV